MSEGKEIESFRDRYLREVKVGQLVAFSSTGVVRLGVVKKIKDYPEDGYKQQQTKVWVERATEPQDIAGNKKVCKIVPYTDYIIAIV